MSNASSRSVGINNASSTSPSNTTAEQDVIAPSGAIAFFVAMLIAFAVIWLGMYEILVVRQNGL